jgi:glycosyltransferase involved in cell wall biosynthesis
VISIVILTSNKNSLLEWNKLILASLFTSSTFVCPAFALGGLPVIATRAEGVEGGVHGLLVPVENPYALAEAVLQLARNPQLRRRRIGIAARQRIKETYTLDHMCEQYLEIFKKNSAV